MRQEHMQQVERWANFVKNNPDKWKKALKGLIDSQIIIARRAYKKLAETREGREKIRRLRRANI